MGRFLWVLISAVTFAVSFPPIVKWGGATAFASLVLLLQALRGVEARTARALGFLWGMVAYGISLSWFWNLFPIFSIALWAVLALFVACFAWMQSLADRRGIAGWRWVVFAAVNWSGWEFIRAELFPLKFPWITPGVSMGPNLFLPWTGVYGMTALMVLLAAVVASRPSQYRAGAWFIGGVLSLCVLGFVSPEVRIDPARSVHVAAVQDESVSMDRYVQHTADLPRDTQVIVWPEYSLPYDVRSNKRDFNTLRDICRERHAVLVVGTHTILKDQKAWFNTALTLNESGVLGEHYKAHPVHFFNDGTAGVTALPVQTPLGAMGTPICFDCDYEGIVRRMTAAGAEWFAVPSMDAESWSAREHLQHAALFRLRACENGRWMVVASSSGVSQIIDPSGRVHGELAPMVVDTLVGELQRETRLTFYTRWGWVTPWILLSAAVICWVALFLRRGRQTGLPPI